jgi:hypothetical protein
MNGYYSFDIRDAFVGDSLAVTSDGTITTYRHLDSNVYFLIKKEGFESQVILVELLRSKLLTRDIILRKAL